MILDLIIDGLGPYKGTQAYIFDDCAICGCHRYPSTCSSFKKSKLVFMCCACSAPMSINQIIYEDYLITTLVSLDIDL